MTPAERKSELRRELRARWRSLSAAEIADGSALICARVAAAAFWQEAAVVLVFAPLPDEVNIRPLIGAALAEGKTVALPRFDSFSNRYMAARVADWEADVAAGAFGVEEPKAGCAEVAAERLDVALVPGVGFDFRANRLGRGKGYYDRLLAGVAGIKCGIALDVQMAMEIPAEEHDIRMDLVMTPAGPAGEKS